LSTQLTTRRRWAVLIMTAVVAALVVTLNPMLPAHAALSSPAGLTPSGNTLSGEPVLQWNRVAGATSYKVDISADDSFGSNVTTIYTVNRRVVPTAHLRSTPTGEIFWRVAARDNSSASNPTTTSYFRQALAGPTLVAPPSGQLLLQPRTRRS